MLGIKTYGPKGKFTLFVVYTETRNLNWVRVRRGRTWPSLQMTWNTSFKANKCIRHKSPAG